MSPLRTVCFASALCLAAGSVSAAPVTLDFDIGKNGMTSAGVINDLTLFSNFGVTLSVDAPNPPLPNTLALFNSNCGPDFGVNCTGGDPDLATGPTYGTTPQGRVLIIQENAGGVPDDALAGGTIRFDFDRLMQVKSVELLDLDESAITVGQIDFRFFYSDNTFSDIFVENLVGLGGAIDLLSFATVTGDNELRRLSFTGGAASFAKNVIGFSITYNNISGAIASITYAPVPVPAALPLLAGGMAVFGFMGWRRRRAA